MNFNYTFSRTEDNLATRTAYDIDQDWAVGVNDQPHVWNALVVYNLPFGADGKPGSGNAVVRAIVKDWQISGITQFRSGRPLGSICAACNLPNAGTCYADFNPNFTGDGPASTATTATATCLAPTRRRTSTGRRSSRPRRSPTATRRGRSRFDLRNPDSFNQDFSVRRDFRIWGVQARIRGRRVQRVQQRRVRRHPDEHHERQLRAGELAGQHAARRTNQGAAGVLTRW